MHISEGVLSAPVLIGGGVLTVIGTGIGLHRLDYDRIMNTAILTSAFFVASLVHVPIGPGSIHLVLNGLLGIILGWACFPAILVALLLQAVFFQFGGLLPVAHAEVEVEFFNSEQAVAAPSDYHVTQVVKADANGIFSFTCPRAGWWGFAALNEADYRLKTETGEEKGVELGAVLWIRLDEYLQP